jgi:hypothetical protein
MSFSNFKTIIGSIYESHDSDDESIDDVKKAVAKYWNAAGAAIRKKLLDKLSADSSKNDKLANMSWDDLDTQAHHGILHAALSTGAVKEDMVVNVEPYVDAHGEDPKGYGLWVFKMIKGGAPVDSMQFTGTLRNAVATARNYAKRKGYDFATLEP